MPESNADVEPRVQQNPIFQIFGIGVTLALVIWIFRAFMPGNNDRAEADDDDKSPSGGGRPGARETAVAGLGPEGRIMTESGHWYQPIDLSPEALREWRAYQAEHNDEPLDHAGPVPDGAIITNRIDAARRNGRLHAGTDFDVAEGTPTLATASGVVLHAGPMGSYGNVVIIGHQHEWYTLYAHLQDGSIPPEVRIGAEVKQGRMIGGAGDTGGDYEVHAHYEQRERGIPRPPVFNGKELDMASTLNVNVAALTLPEGVAHDPHEGDDMGIPVMYADRSQAAVRTT